MTRGRASAALGAVGLLLAGCGLLPGLQPAPAGRDGPMIGGPDDTEPIGPIVEIGRGESLGMSWRYSVYESAMGTCTTVDTDGQGGGSSCGGTLGAAAGGAKLSVMSFGSGTGIPSTVEGFAAAEVAEVWVTLGDGSRVQATLMSLEPTGRPGQLFFAVVPGDRALFEVVALDEDGDVLASEPLGFP